jgi:CcmD family protein
MNTVARIERGRRSAVARRLVVAVLLTAAVIGAASSVAFAWQPQAQRPQDEFVPVKDLGQQEPLRAAPLLVAAYIVVWLALLAYLWSIWRRLGKVDRELSALTRRLAEKSGAQRQD